MAEINRNYTHYIEKIRKKKIIPLIKKINNIPATIDFNLHIWWAKKPNNIISTLIKELSNENEIILDPFIGSGVSAIEALKLNRKIIAFDISKLAIFITKSIINCYNKSKFTNLFDKIVLNLQNKVYGTEHYKITDLYLTRCPICGKKSQFLYMVYDLDSPKWLRLMCTHNNRLKNIKKTTLDEDDFKLINKCDNIKIPFWIPDVKLYKNTRINIHDHYSVKTFFTKRNLIAISILLHEISQIEECLEKSLLYFIFSSILRKCSKLIGLKGGLSIGYWIPKIDRKENNPILQFIKAKNKILNNWQYINKLEKNSQFATCYGELIRGKQILIKQLPVQDLNNFVPKNSIDLVITDPPYGDEVPYLELSALWSSWLKLMPSKDDFENEIVLSNSPYRPNKNPRTTLGLKNYKTMMEHAFKNIALTLKPEHFACIWFHELELPIWNIMIEAALKAGLIYVEQTYISTSNIRSLKSKLTPFPTLTGHVLSFFIKLPDSPINFNDKNTIDQINYTKIDQLILDLAKSIIKKQGGSATTNELYINAGLYNSGIISTLIKKNLLGIVSKKYNNLFSIFNKELQFNKNDGKWYISN
ncbi:MAG: DNA methyltransferase [Candidatus Helarchaeota archaeon]